jgi:hypothetical protein
MLNGMNRSNRQRSTSARTDSAAAAEEAGTQLDVDRVLTRRGRHEAHPGRPARRSVEHPAAGAITLSAA